jgi:hypothetical protein
MPHFFLFRRAKGIATAEKRGTGHMTNQEVFANRVARINKAAKKPKRAHRSRAKRNFAAMMVTPMMMALFMSGGMVYAWDAMDRPTDSPFEMAQILTAQVLSF